MDLKSSHSFHPRINLVGETNGGKSTLLASITGISIGTTTICPIEWNIRRSDVWSACVSFGYFNKLDSEEPFALMELETITVDGATYFCSTPQQIGLLVRMAQIIAFSPLEDFQHILSMDDDDIDKAIMRQLYCSTHSKGAVSVELHCPVFSCSEMTIVDLPGTKLGNAKQVDYVKKIIRHYVLQNRSMTTVVARASDHEQHVRRSVLNYVQRIIRESGGNMEGEFHFHASAYDILKETIVTMALSYSPEPNMSLNQIWISVLKGDKKRSYDCYVFLLPTCQSSGPFPIQSVQDMLAIRQDESAYFLFVEPWCAWSENERRRLGTGSVLKAWSASSSAHHPKDASSRSLNSWIIFSLVRVVILFVVVSVVAILVD